MSPNETTGADLVASFGVERLNPVSVRELHKDFFGAYDEVTRLVFAFTFAFGLAGRWLSSVKPTVSKDLEISPGFDSVLGGGEGCKIDDRFNLMPRMMIVTNLLLQGSRRYSRQ